MESARNRPSDDFRTPRVSRTNWAIHNAKEGGFMNIKRGDIYYADFDIYIGSEQGGKRPVVIIQNDIGNRWSPTVIVAAVTSKIKKTVLPTHVEINTESLAKDSIALLEQIKTIDKSRLGDYLGTVDNETMKNIDDAIKISLGINYNQ